MAMNENIRNLIIKEKMPELSKYIELGIVKMEDVFNELMSLNNIDYFYSFALYVKGASR